MHKRIKGAFRETLIILRCSAYIPIRRSQISSGRKAHLWHSHQEAKQPDRKSCFNQAM